MPVYTYRCENCGVQFERHQSYDDASLKVCPECHKRSLKKVIAPVRVVFKGSGFYVTDNKSPSSTSTKPAKPVKKEEGKDSKETKSDDKKSSEKSSEKSG